MTTFGLDVPAFHDGKLRSFYGQVVTTAEDAGFTNLWVGDHLLWHRPRLETFTLLGMLSGLTDLTLGTGIALAPLRQPWWVAKSAGTLHTVAPGGFILGMGTGGEYSREFELVGVAPTDRGPLLDKTIAFCRGAWSGHLAEDFSPLLDAPPPVWVAGRKNRALRRAAEQADGWLGIFLSPEGFAESRAFLHGLCETMERPPTTAAMALWVCVDTDPDKALTTALAMISREYRLPAERFARYVVTGTPDDLAASFAAYAHAGAEHLDLHIAHPDPLAQIELLGSSGVLSREVLTT